MEAPNLKYLPKNIYFLKIFENFRTVDPVLRHAVDKIPVDDWL
jgi:hypothetical protein